MPRPPRPKEFSDLVDLAQEIISATEDLKLQYSFNQNVQDELQACADYANIIARKAPRIQRLAKLEDRMPVVIEADGTVRELSSDETLRLIMNYKTGNAIDIMRHWTVVDGEWVERPKNDPDPSVCARIYREEEETRRIEQQRKLQEFFSQRSDKN